MSSGLKTLNINREAAEKNGEMLSNNEDETSNRFSCDAFIPSGRLNDKSLFITWKKMFFISWEIKRNNA